MKTKTPIHYLTDRLPVDTSNALHSARLREALDRFKFEIIQAFNAGQQNKTKPHEYYEQRFTEQNL